MVVILICSAQESDVNRHSCSTLPCMTFVYNVLFFSFYIFHSHYGLPLEFTEIRSINFMFFLWFTLENGIVAGTKSSIQNQSSA